MTPLANDRQVAFASRLMDERDLFASDRWFDQVNAMDAGEYATHCTLVKESFKTMSKDDISKTIDKLLALPVREELLPEPELLAEAIEKLERMHADGRLNGFTQGLYDAYKRYGTLSKARVECLLKGKPGQGEIKVTEIGVYETPEGIFVVKPNKAKTNLYAMKLVEINAERATEAGERVKIEFRYERGAIFTILPEHKMDLERAKELTIRYGRCIVCGKALRAAESVERGIGPVCIKSFAQAVPA